MKNTKIEWTDHTWNPLRGCSRVSEGCRNCYAETVAGRFSGPGMPYEGLITKTAKGPTWNGSIKLVPEKLSEPLRWTKPRMIFVNSMSDLFHENVPDEYIDRVFAVMALAPHHTFQVLTKRPERMRRYLSHVTLERIADSVPKGDWPISFAEAGARITGSIGRGSGLYRVSRPEWPLPNVWLGVSVENQESADERIPLLLDTPAAVRWISAEPLLGPVRLDEHGLHGGPGQLDWVVVGGESGLNARPMHPDWVSSIREQCNEAGVAFLFKQWGEWKPISQGADDWFDGLYKPNRIAKEYEDQGALNDSYGRTCTVKNGIVHFDGTLHSITEIGAWLVGTKAMHTFKVGKKAAGRGLDGRTWDEYPRAKP